MRIGKLLALLVLAAAAIDCNCGHITTCRPPCPAGQTCEFGQCVPGCASSADCPAGKACVDGTCLSGCLGSSCETQVPDSGSPPRDAGAGPCAGQRSCGEYCVPIGGCCASSECNDGICYNGECVPPNDAGEDAGSPPVDAGQPGPDAGGGSCYQCAVTHSTCGLAVQPFVDGGCPTGWSTTQPTCTPCWSCAAGSAYCPNSACCGPNWTTSGYVGAGCTCYGCNAWGYGADENGACVNAQDNTLASSGGFCPWPAPGETAFCGFAGYSGSSSWYNGATPGGCDCFFSCTATSACCVPKNEPVKDCSQCCSGQCTTCIGGQGNNCCA